MGLTRKLLKSMGITDDNIVERIYEAHSDVVAELKDERDKFKSDAQRLGDAEKELKALKANNEGDSWKEKYDKLQADFDSYKEKQEEEKTRQATVNAYKEILKKTGVSEKRIDSILKITDVSEFKLDKDGKLKDADKITKNVKEEWSDFIVKEGTEGAKVENPPKNTGGTKMTKDEIFKIKDAKERQQAIADNHELFGF